MLFFAFIPEIVSFLTFILVSVQETPIGPLLVAAQFGLFGLLVATRPALFVQTLMRWWPLLLVPILAVASASWSAVPGDTARYALQFLFTAVVGVFFAKVLSPRKFVIVLLLALFVFCIMCIISGRQGTSFHNYVLIGLTGSKNQLAYEAQVLMLAAFATLMLRDISIPLRWIATLALPLSVYLLIETESSTAIVTAVGGSILLAGLAFAQRFTPGGRVATIAGALLCVLPLTVLIPEIVGAINHFVFDTLNKDPTLTGRTLLWARADDLIARRPFFGYGYQAIWMGDSADTIGLRRLTGITDARVFHFHNQFRQTGVDTGLVGLGVLLSTLVVVGLAHMRQFLLRPSVPISFFFLLFVLTVSRSYIDVIIGPFSIHTFLFYAACVYAFQSAQQSETQAAPAPNWSQYRAAPASRFVRR